MRYSQTQAEVVPAKARRAKVASIRCWADSLPKKARSCGAVVAVSVPSPIVEAATQRGIAKR